MDDYDNDYQLEESQHQEWDFEQPKNDSAENLD